MAVQRFRKGKRSVELPALLAAERTTPTELRALGTTKEGTAWSGGRAQPDHDSRVHAACRSRPSGSLSGAVAQGRQRLLRPECTMDGAEAQWRRRRRHLRLECGLTLRWGSGIRRPARSGARRWGGASEVES
ncbi:hypothetical protein ZWY2020_014851 [Hordeum vulgare]|nr:hypothetical protein ZWY2020_014851 [Hordeum vulgare]